MMILVVDDHPINRRLLADQLGSLGYQCKTANDGVDALNVLSKNHIDIVLSDVNMPNMDGYRSDAAHSSAWPDAAGGGRNGQCAGGREAALS